MSAVTARHPAAICEIDAGGVSTPELTSPGPFRPLGREPLSGVYLQWRTAATSKTVAVQISISAPKTSPVIPPSFRQASLRSHHAAPSPAMTAARPRAASGAPPAAPPAAPVTASTNARAVRRALLVVVPAIRAPNPSRRAAGKPVAITTAIRLVTTAAASALAPSQRGEIAARAVT